MELDGLDRPSLANTGSASHVPAIDTYPTEGYAKQSLVGTPMAGLPSVRVV